jgi:uncharacterized protein YecT (DUF1311 family)
VKGKDIMVRSVTAASVVILFIATSPPSSAQTTDGSAALKACMSKSGGVTADMRACLNTEYKRLDRDLNTTYASVMKQLKTKDLRERLVNSQRVWIWRRDDYCKREAEQSGVSGGTAGDLIYDECRVTMVRERIIWLKKVPKNPAYLAKV